MSQLTKVILKGSLGEEYGEEHEFLIYRPRDVISALEANFPGFKAHLLKLESEGIGYQLITPTKPDGLTEEDLDEPCSIPELMIVPVVVGSGGGVGRVLLGVALLAVGAAVPFAAVAGGTTLALLGGSLILGGINQWISPVKKNTSSKEQKRSSGFDSALGTSSRNAVVPVLFGRMRISPPVLSSGISTERIP